MAAGNGAASAKANQKRLGRGLQALIGDVDGARTPSPAPTPSGPPRTLPIDALSPNSRNPRQVFDEAELETLTDSVRERGVMQPLLVRPSGDRYEIVAGERRWRAAQRAGLHDVPVVIRETDNSEALELAIIENVQRSDLNPIEEAAGYQQLMSEFAHKPEIVARLIGKSRSHVANLVRLLNLPDVVQTMVSEGTLSAGHARALLSAPDPEATARLVARTGMSVRATEALVQRLNTVPPMRKTEAMAAIETADTRALVRRLSDRLGLKVDLAHKADETGTLIIHYSTLDQLDAVCRQLGED